MKPYTNAGISPPDLTASLCLNQRHNGLGCVRCIASCPTAAITLSEAQPNLDPSLCVSCGACSATCPIDAIAAPSTRPENVLVTNLGELNSGMIGVVCNQPQDPADNHLRVDAVGVHQRCLAGVDLPTLLQLLAASSGDVWLDDSQCSDCQIGHVHRAIASAAVSANALMNSVDSAKRVRLATSDMAKPHAVAAPQIVDTERFRVGRRGMFSLLKARADSLATKPVEPERSPGNLIDQTFPASRSALLARLANWDPPVAGAASSELPYGDVIIDPSRCTACGLCARFCPTAALRLDTLEDRFAIGFWGSSCVDCGLCATACVEDAVSFGRTIQAAEIVAGPPRRLVEGQITSCRDCGAQTAVMAESVPTCSSCRHGLGTITPLGDDRGLMDDLFGPA